LRFKQIQRVQLVGDPGRSASPSSHGIAECCQTWRDGLSSARWSTQPSRMTTVLGCSAALANSGAPQSGQKTWARRLPLAAVLRQVSGEPHSTKLAIGALTMARKGAPDNTWQSLQWHSTTCAGSISAVKEIDPQWQRPVMCMLGGGAWF
jgi:hypothetical protein